MEQEKQTMHGQRQMILDYLKENGTITPFEAFSKLGITKLATRISEMKRAGYTFKQEMCTSTNRYGKECRYMRYALREGE